MQVLQSFQRRVHSKIIVSCILLDAAYLYIVRLLCIVFSEQTLNESFVTEQGVTVAALGCVYHINPLRFAGK